MDLGEANNVDATEVGRPFEMQARKERRKEKKKGIEGTEVTTIPVRQLNKHSIRKLEY